MVRKSKSRSKKVNRGGGQGAGYGAGAALLPGTQIDAQIRAPYDSCMTVDRPGQMSFSTSGGLPGMRGGSCNKVATGGAGCKVTGGAVYGKAITGGRYSVDPSQSIAGFAEVVKIPCDPSLTHFNPLNQHFTQAGGVGLVGASDMGVLQEGTARYTTAPSGWVGGTGAPVLLNQALDQVAWSKACTQTAGRRSIQKRKTRRTSRKKKSRSRR